MSSTAFPFLPSEKIQRVAVVCHRHAKLQGSRGVKVLVDHHPIQDGSPYDHMIVDTGASSACEIVSTIFRGLGAKMDATTAQALLLGIMFDAQHLLIAKDRTLREVV